MSLLQIGRRRRSSPQLKNRIYISVSSEGYGHSSRALALAGQFDRDDILLGTYSYALERVRGYDYPCVEVTQEVKFIGSEGQFDVGKTILQNPARALGLNQVVQEEMRVMKRQGITLVIADGRIAPVLAASKLDLPCLALTNQSAFYPFFAQDSPLIKLFGRSFEWVMKLWLSSAEEIWVPDFAPPHTVCLPNLSTNYQVKKRTRFVGPLVAWQAYEVEPAPIKQAGRRLVVVSLGGHEYRRPLFDAVLKAARQLSSVDFHVIAGFEAKNPPPNVHVHAFVRDAACYFQAADLVITQAGHSTAMELLTLGKPSLIVPDSYQIEQQNNAQRMVELGVALQLSYEDLARAGRNLLCEHIQTLLESPAFEQRTRELAALAAATHGAANAAGMLREYAHRLTAY